MKRTKVLTAHLVATAVALLTIFSFFTASLYAEWVGEARLIVATKTAILYGLPLMMVAMPTLAITGNALAGNRSSSLIQRKRQRMKVVVINGVTLIMLAFFLFWRAQAGQLDAWFNVAQGLELLLGATNFTLLGLNVGTGRMLSGKSFTGQTALSLPQEPSDR